jgi:radical SAM superfamily enzyme YgiQ (UPF0313 family)
LRVLLISPNILTAPYPVYPIGLDYVAGALEGRHDIRILDLNQEAGPAVLQRAIDGFKPDIIGFSIRNVDNTDASNSQSFIAGYKSVVDGIRKYSDAPLVLGGSGFTIFPEALMKALNADYGIQGDGESMARLADALENHGDPAAIPGVMVKGFHAPCPPDLPDRTVRRRFNRDDSHVDYYLKRGGMLNIQTKRGCPFRCVYCTYPHIDGGRLRLSDPADVADTAVALQEAGAKYLFVTDSTFNCSVSHSLAVAKAFIRAGLAIPWGAFFAPLDVPHDYYRIMADAGLAHVEFGTESLSDAVLAAYGKPFRKTDVFRAHRMALDAGVHVAHYLMPGGPGEDEATLSETLAAADKLEKTVLFFFCGVRIYPHTALYDLALREGQISPGQDLLTPVFYQSGKLTSDAIKEKLAAHADGRSHWLIGSGGDKTAKVVSRLYARGHHGPLWELLTP